MVRVLEAMNRILTHVNLPLSQHSVLDLGFSTTLQQRIIDIAESAVGHGRTDRVQGLGHLNQARQIGGPWRRG